MSWYADFSIEVKEKLNDEQIQSAEKYFKVLKLLLNPRIPKTQKEIIEFLLGDNQKTNGFLKNGGHNKGTLHENLFHWLHPEYETQVSFGTGREGLKNFGCSKVTVDFLSGEHSIAYEIDGPNHKTYKQFEKDEFKERLLQSKHGICTVRLTNQEVEDEVMWDLLTWLSVGANLNNHFRFRELPINNLLQEAQHEKRTPPTIQ